MKNKDINLDLKALPAALGGYWRKMRTYRVFIFFLVVATLYGYIVWRINVFSSTPADSGEVASQQSAQPHIDQATVDKIKSLQDNSVSVQSLFDSARDNPFQE